VGSNNGYPHLIRHLNNSRVAEARRLEGSKAPHMAQIERWHEAQAVEVEQKIERARHAGMTAI
jgi:hypothetical protein